MSHLRRALRRRTGARRAARRARAPPPKRLLWSWHSSVEIEFRVSGRTSRRAAQHRRGAWDALPQRRPRRRATATSSSSCEGARLPPGRRAHASRHARDVRSRRARLVVLVGGGGGGGNRMAAGRRRAARPRPRAERRRTASSSRAASAVLRLGDAVVLGTFDPSTGLTCARAPLSRDLRQPLRRAAAVEGRAAARRTRPSSSSGAPLEHIWSA